jgi:hypothetical protein
MWIGNATQGSAPFQVTKTGVITATSGTVGGWTLGSTTLTGGDKVLLDQRNSKIVIADDVTNISEGITISYGSADVGAGYTANKVHVIAGDDTDIVFNADYGRDFFFTPGRIRQWYIQGGQGGGGSSDPSADSIGNFNTGGSGIAGISGKLYYDAGLVGISSNYGGNMTDNEVNSAIFGWNSRGASGTVCAGVHGLVNRGNVAGVLGEAYGWGSDTSDMAENLVSGLFRGGAFIVGNAYTSSASDQSNNDVDYALIAYPRTKYGATHENRVGINKRQPTVALDVIGEIKASSNITALLSEYAVMLLLALISPITSRATVGCLLFIPTLFS